MRPCGQDLVLCSAFFMDLIAERVLHTMSMIERGNGQKPHLFDRARIGEFKRRGTSPTIQPLVHLCVTTLAAADNSAFRILLNILLKLTTIPSLCAMMNAYKFDERTLVRFADYHSKSLTQSKPLQSNFTRGSGLEDLSSGWKP
jgi:hypothetical protein